MFGPFGTRTSWAFFTLQSEQNQFLSFKDSGGFFLAVGVVLGFICDRFVSLRVPFRFDAPPPRGPFEEESDRCLNQRRWVLGFFKGEACGGVRPNAPRWYDSAEMRHCDAARRPTAAPHFNGKTRKWDSFSTVVISTLSTRLLGSSSLRQFLRLCRQKEDQIILWCRFLLGVLMTFCSHRSWSVSGSSTEQREGCDDEERITGAFENKKSKIKMQRGGEITSDQQSWRKE